MSYVVQYSLIHYDQCRAGIDTLESRREQLTERFFKRSVLPETSCLHYLQPDKRDVSVTGRLRHARTFEPVKPRTVKFSNSFIPYCLNFKPLCLGLWLVILPVC